MDETQDRIEDRADQLIESHYRLMQDLIELRKKNRLSQEEVGTRMGTSQPAVASFESYDSNPTLSSIRRYALAVGARIEYKVVDDLVVGMAATAMIKDIQNWTATSPLIDNYIFSASSANTDVNG